MRILSALLVLLLLCSLQLTSSAPAGLSPGCCPSRTNMKIALAQVESYTWTPDECHFKAIVFHTKKRKDVVCGSGRCVGQESCCCFGKHTY